MRMRSGNLNVNFKESERNGQKIRFVFLWKFWKSGFGKEYGRGCGKWQDGWGDEFSGGQVWEGVNGDGEFD